MRPALFGWADLEKEKFVGRDPQLGPDPFDVLGKSIESTFRTSSQHDDGPILWPSSSNGDHVILALALIDHTDIFSRPRVCGHGG